MIIAGQDRLTTEGAIDQIRAYARQHNATIIHYDLGGPDAIDLDDRVLPGDLGRMILINSRLGADDAASLLKFNLPAMLAGLSVDLRLQDIDFDDPNERLPVAMDHVWFELKLLRGVKTAKASKLLHLKRPNLFPIVDSRIIRLYEPEESRLGRVPRWPLARFWREIAADVRANAGELVEIREGLRATAETARLAHLSDLRLLDILAWQLPNGRSQRLSESASSSREVVS